MTQAQIDQAFIEAIESDAFKALDLTKYQRYNYRHRDNGLAKKLEVLYLCNKLALK